VFDNVPSSSFGAFGNGITELPMPNGISVDDLYCTPSVTAGGYTYVVSCTSTELIVWRLEPFNGLLDPNFGVSGLKTFPMNMAFPLIGTTDSGGSLIVAAGTREIVGGPAHFTAIQITHGVFDTSFGGTGIVRIPFATGLSTERSYATDIKFERNWKHLVIAGRTQASASNARQFALARLNLDGTLDGSFGSGGTTQFSVATGENFGRKFDFDSLGRIVMTGTVTFGPMTSTSPPGGQFRIGVARLHNDGSLDTDFGNGYGRVVFSGDTIEAYPGAGYCEDAQSFDVVTTKFGTFAKTDQISIAGTCVFAPNPTIPIDRQRITDTPSVGFVLRLDSNGRPAGDFGPNSNGFFVPYYAIDHPAYKRNGSLTAFAIERRGWHVGDNVYLYGKYSVCPTNAPCFSEAVPTRLLPAVP
jgi:uncharacterized delta-60 repeat protein